uniref:Uncharacterized protein n=1 Tax=Tanacetum cinerariifolium TaxID=118510 RepID=A0A6L2JCY2_TANCI|nr:hypothetical protein [Tanacetum cinerariifolium]
MQTQTSNTLHNAIMEAGSKDPPPMLAPGNYIQWKSRIKRYIDTKPNRELIHYCLENPSYELGWKEKPILDAEGNPTNLTDRLFETYKNVKQEIRDQLNAEAEAVQIILTEIDNDIYSTVDACPNACEMWKAIERLKQGESINVQDLETNLFWEFGKFTSLDGETLESYYSSSEVMEIVIPEVGGIDDDILLTIKDDILREKLLNVNLLISKIEALNANPTPSSDCKTKSSSTSLNFFLEETNTFDNSLPEFKTFCFDVEEISSGSTTTHLDISLSKYEAFYDDHVKEISSGSPTTHSDSSLYASFIFDLSINPFLPADMIDFYEFTDELIPYRHQSMIVSFLRLNQTRGISPRMW